MSVRRALLTLAGALVLSSCSVQDYNTTLDDGREAKVVLIRDAIAGSFNVNPTVAERKRIREKYETEFPKRAQEICSNGYDIVKGPKTWIKGTQYGSGSVTTSTTIVCQ